MSTRPLIEAISPVQPDLLADIATAATKAYDGIADRSPKLNHDNIYYLGFCHEASRAIASGLSEAGYQASVENADVPVPLDYYKNRTYFLSHAYCVLAQAAPAEIVVDATWQQFLREPRPDGLPKVLVGSRPAFIARVLSHGLRNKPTANLWQPEAFRTKLQPLTAI